MTIPASTLLTSADDWARDLLLDAHDDQAPAGGLLAGWAQVMQAAAGAWQAIRHQDPHGSSPFDQAVLTASQIIQDASQQPGLPDPRTMRIAGLLDAIVETIPTQPPSANPVRPDEAALRTGILHVGYVLTHAVATSIGHRAAQATPEASSVAWQTHQRIRGVEQLLDAHLHGGRRTPIANAAAEVYRSLNGWLRAAYRAPELPDPMTQLILADTAGNVLGNAARLSIHAAQSRQLDVRDVRQRLLPAIRDAAGRWEDSRTLWATMLTPTSRQLPEIVTAATRLQQALRQPDLTSQPTAHAATISSALVAVSEVALINHRGLTHSELTAAASTATRLTTEALDKDQHGHSAYKAWTSMDRREGPVPIRLPEVVRDDLAARGRATMQATLAARSAGHILTQPTRLSPCATFHMAQETTSPSRESPRIPSARTNSRPPGITP